MTRVRQLVVRALRFDCKARIRVRQEGPRMQHLRRYSLSDAKPALA